MQRPSWIVTAMDAQTRRTHMVLVPGFGGFDALGQIFYYAGVAFSAKRWREQHALRAPSLSLHFVDGLPTAGVRTRAMGLRAFLEERRLRNIIQDDDRIALIGHSTGGLDIRQLLVNLGVEGHKPSGPSLRSFGTLRDLAEPAMVPDEQVRLGIERLVFLSVPQRGTNIADFVKRFRMPLRAALETLETQLRLSHIGVVDWLERLTLPLLPLDQASPQLFAALRDALVETLPPKMIDTPRDRYNAALSRAAYAELRGWLDNVEVDFFAIDDLAVEPPKDDQHRTPAHYDDAQRELERKAWAAAGITTRSFATIARRPYDEKPRTGISTLDETFRFLRELGPDRKANTDLPYRFAYAATAAGPFKPDPNLPLIDDGSGPRKLEASDNDGIANTASMFWPDGAQTRLVKGDHGDIIGHYEPTAAKKAAEKQTGRKNHSYDIFGSNSGFNDVEYDKVWHEIFDFCTAR